MKKITVAVAGNPNVGKTTILNHLAGTSLKVGNWPGVTVEKKEAVLEYDGYTLHLVDLPGIYTLKPLSEDEEIAVSFLEKGEVDVILNVLDSTNLERNLFLTAELLEFEKPTVLVLNLYDEAEKLGIRIKDGDLAELLGVEVVKTIAKKGQGVQDILPALIRVYEERRKPKLRYSDSFEEFLSSVPGSTKREKIQRVLGDERLRREFKERFGREFAQALEEERFAFAHGLYEEVVSEERPTARDLTDALDRIVLHPIVGIPLFFLVMFLTFKIAFDFASPFVEWVDSLFGDFLGPLAAHLLQELGAPSFLRSFVAEAVIGGVGFVLTFVPLIFILYLLITFLEMSGYIPRVAFVMDKFFHRIGLHGKSVIPLILALGCNVPAIVATRTLESTREKLIVMAMIPFISCPARLVVFSFFALIFFPENPALVILSLYLLGVVVAVLTALVLRKKLGGSLSHFVIELPPYRLPHLRTLLNISWIHVKDFLYRAGTLIFGASLFIWALLNLPPGVKNPENSLAGAIGRVLVPVFEPMGIDDWRATTSLIPAFLAREIVISSMGVIYTATGEEEREEEFSFSERLEEVVAGLGEAFVSAVRSTFSLKLHSLAVEEEAQDGLRAAIRQHFSPASSLAFMVFILLYTSCLGTYATLGREMGFSRATLFLGYSFLIAWVAGTITYHLFS